MPPAAMTPERIEQEARRLAGRGLLAGAYFFKARVQEALSAPAPRRLVRPRRGGPPYYRATTPATPGAPPRKLSGALRSSGAVEPVRAGGELERVRVGFLIVYAAPHERGDHPFLVPTLRRFLPQIAGVIGAQLRSVSAG